MSKTHAAKAPLPTKSVETNKSDNEARRNFLVLALTMSWQLAVVVLVFVIGGAELDKALKTKYVFTFIGLGLALVGSIVIMWRAVQAANRIPVPKLTADQRRAIQKQYEAEDDD